MNVGELLCAFVVMSGAAAHAQEGLPAGDGVAVQVVSVLATNSGELIDPRLSAVRRHFSDLPYSSYQLLRRQTRHVAWGDQARFNLPGARELNVQPRRRDDDGVALSVGLRGERRRRLVDTDLCLQDHRVLVVDGTPYGDGVLVVLVGTTPDSMARKTEQGR